MSVYGLLAEGKFSGHGVSKILARGDKFFWPRLASVGVRSSGGILFWFKCLGAKMHFSRMNYTGASYYGLN